MMQLYRSESKSHIAWNGYLDSHVVCLHWSYRDFIWKLDCNPLWSDVGRKVSLSLSFKYNCTIIEILLVDLWWGIADVLTCSVNADGMGL